MTIPQSPIDRRPFRSKAECLREDTLQTRYRNVAIPDVVAALAQPKHATTAKPVTTTRQTR